MNEKDTDAFLQVLQEISSTLSEIKDKLDSIDDSIIGAGRVLTNFRDYMRAPVEP